MCMNKCFILVMISMFAGAMQKPEAKNKVPEKIAINQKMQDQFVDAIAQGNVNEVRRLLRFRPQIDVNTVDSHGDRPLEGAVRIRNAQIVQLLLENGANPNLIMSSGMTPGMTPLMYAVSLGNPEIVELLLQYGADRDAIFNDNKAQGGRDRKAIDFLSGSGPKYEKIKSMLIKTKLR